MKKCWDMIRKISGKRGGMKVHHLSKHGATITDVKDIANEIGETISKNSSSNSWNRKFSMEELMSSLAKSHDTAPGPDQIHYQILKHLPDLALYSLLEIMNDIWDKGEFPDSWKEALIIPIPKPEKDHTNPNNYRPIALTSCICKTMERMINERLLWYLETEALLSVFQSGFRKSRSTIDHLIRLETFIREGFIKGEHVVAVFFDLEKAYDRTWKYGILKDLHEMGLRGKLPLMIKDFLSERSFKVRMGNTLSESFEQEMGVPQGSILSVTLFIIKINSIAKCMKQGRDCSFFVDDF